MKTSLIVNSLDNSISLNYAKISDMVISALLEFGVTTTNYLVTSNFRAEFERLIYSNDIDFLITLGNNSSQIRGTKKVFALPTEVEEINEFIDNAIIPFVQSSTGHKYQTLCIKTFGVMEKDIKLLLAEYFNNENIIINTFAHDLDVKTVVKYDTDLDRNISQDIISGIYGKLRKFIYTDDNISLYHLAVDLLKISNKKIAIAETITKGRIIDNLLLCENCDNRIIQGFVAPSALNLKDTLSIPEEQFNHGDNNVEICYEMAAGLLEKTNADFVITNCGNLNQEFCYIAVGDIDGIHVYKNRCSGSADRLVETLAKSSVFYLIKKIKQNDLFFNQIIV